MSEDKRSHIERDRDMLATDAKAHRARAATLRTDAEQLAKGGVTGQVQALRARRDADECDALAAGLEKTVQEVVIPADAEE